jgi:hypothetical protein
VLLLCLVDLGVQAGDGLLQALDPLVQDDEGVGAGHRVRNDPDGNGGRLGRDEHVGVVGRCGAGVVELVHR